MSSYTDLGTFNNNMGYHGHTMFPEYRPLGSHRPYYGLISQTTVLTLILESPGIRTMAVLPDGRNNIKWKWWEQPECAVKKPALACT